MNILLHPHTCACGGCFASSPGMRAWIALVYPDFKPRFRVKAIYERVNPLDGTRLWDAS